MKRRFTLLAALFMLLTTGLVWGQTRDEVVAYTLDGTITGGDNSYAGESTITQDNLTWKVMGNTTMSPWRIGGKNLTGENRPVYSTGTISDNITKIVVTHGSASSITVNSMTLVVSSNADFSNPTSTMTGDFAASSTTTFTRPSAADWSGKYFKIIYNVTVSGSTNRYLQFTKAEFYKENSGGGQETVATPTFSPAAGTYYEAQNVTISCSTTGATIYYTTDGTAPTTSSLVYSNPIAISETTTVKAMGVKSGMDISSVATATYTIQQLQTITTIAGLWEFAATAGSSTPSQPNANVTFNDWYVTGVKGSQAWVSDGQYGFVIYQSGHGFVAGDKLSGTMACKVVMYQNHYAEIMGVKATDLTVVSGQEMPVLTTSIAALEVRNYGTAINLGTCSYNGIKFYDAAGDSIALYNNFNVNPNPISSLEAGKQYNVKGVSIIYWTSNSQTQQIAPRSADDFEEVVGPTEQVVTPTFTPVAGEYNEAQNVTIACTTQGATIHYTLDGTNPTANSAVYNGPIAINETTTVKAFAVKDNMIDSEIATATYTISIAPPTPTLTFHKLYSHNAVTNTGTYMIVDVAGGYALTSANGTASAPAAVAVTIEGDSITGEIDPALQWNFTVVDGGYKINPINDTVFLYTTDANNGVRVGTNANNVWELDVTGSSTQNYHGFKNGATGRYIGVYKATPDWRAYTSINNNIKDTKIEIFVLGDAPTPPAPTYYTVSVAQGITNGTVSVDTTSNLVGGETITVTATPAAGYELATLTYTYGQTTTNINQTTMQFTMPSADVTVNATFTELDHVANPTFTPAAGSFITAQQVSIACATEGATIHYTTDGTDPTTNSAVYAEPFTLSATTTVKAMAVKAGMNNSDVISATYTIIEPMAIAQARALADDTYALVQGVVTFIDGRNIYVQDETAGVDLYLNTNTIPQALAIGDMVLGYGKKTVYKGLVELTGIAGNNANQFVILSSNNPLPVAVKTIAEILEDAAGSNMLQSTRVQIVDAIVGTINTNNNTPITQGESTLNIYKMPVVEGLEEGDIATVIGVIGCYNTLQLRVATATDVTFVHPAGITVTPASLSGFTYVYEEGPSTVKTFNIKGRSLTAPTHIIAPESYEMSSFPGETFYPESQISINVTGAYEFTIKVRLKAGLEIGEYNETITITQADVEDITIALTGNVTDSQPIPPTGDYVRVSDLSQLTSGSKVIFAARYNETVNEYYAMTAQATGKPEGVLFTSVVGTTETLPSEIADAEDTYYWTVDVNGANYTFTNANGDVLGYTSGTNFATGGDNTAWTITYQTSEASAMVPEYSAFVVNNVDVAVRAIALNSNHNFGPYHTQNMAADNYNFFLDMFATVGGGTLTCATPTFAPEGGTYYEAQEVTLACSTADATIYYTLDGTDPTAESPVYTEPIAVDESMTLKAIAMKEGYENSAIATAEYTIILGAVTIFEQDWEGEMNGWTFVSVEGEKPWTIGQYQGNHYANANGYNGGVNEQWCISPAFDLNVYSNANLTFRNAKNYTGPDVQLFFSNNYDGESPATATWTELEFNKSTGSYAWVESGVIDLADFTGSDCYIGFKYTSTETEASAWEIDDIMLMGFTTQPYLTVTPTALNGFTYIVGNGPSQVQTFTVSGGNLPPAPGGTTGGITVTCSNTHYEFSLDGEEFWPYTIGIQATGTLEPTTVYVRLEAGLYVGQWDGVVTLEDGGTTASLTVSGTVTEEPIPGGDWNRIYALSDLNDGDQIILASRYDATVGDGYYAMTAGVTGKPDGVLFTSVNNAGAESLPAEIADNAETYLWNVTLDGDVIILVNAAGDTLGYSSSTNFANGTNPEWNIALQTSEEGALIPNYTGFVITNGTTTNRGIAKNASHKFGAYATSNMGNTDYNFYLDIFVMGGSVTPVVATPVISVPSGTYYEEFDVEITCATEGAAIYYTTDGTEPTAESDLYTEPIHVAQDMTLKAIAMMEGYQNSGIATANYVVQIGVIVIFNQDWEGEMDGWTFVTIYGNKPWTIATHNGNKYANANGYNDDVDNDQWCISPAFNLNNYEGVTLTFMNAMKFTGPDLELYFSNNYDGQDPTTAMWQRLDFTMSEGNYTWTESGEISLNSFSGSNCYIGFRYTSTIEDGAASWEIDDIVLTATSITSVSEAEAMNVNLWNYDNEIFVENNTDNNVQLSVFNVLGQQVLAKTVAAGSVRFTHNLAKGLYIVTLQRNGERMSGKIIVR